jgi:hypothetical protein
MGWMLLVLCGELNFFFLFSFWFLALSLDFGEVERKGGKEGLTVGIGVSVKRNWMGWVQVLFRGVRLRFWRLRLWGGGSVAWGWWGRLLGSLEDDGFVERGVEGFDVEVCWRWKHVQ